jgi:2-polyprenyl-3-methyl-5-hydroxy-6-metoxy-1,4-benzoquinol methylase
MFEFHADRKRYFDIQVSNATAYVLPFIEEQFPVQSGMRVLEVGCGEGGVLKAFTDRGCTGVGVEFDQIRIQWGKEWMKKEMEDGLLHFLARDIYDVDAVEELGGQFDIIILKDVIEHIHDQPRLIGRLKLFLKPEGVIFFGFPPWQMPFGGHQQICKNKWLSRLPYYHLLPTLLYRSILKTAGENVAEMMEIKQTGISIERFEKICKQQGYTLLHQRHYLLNPIYEWKFGWKPKTQFSWLQAIPYIRNFFTTCVYYTIRKQ